jgi:hypothetical protein
MKQRSLVRIPSPPLVWTCQKKKKSYFVKDLQNNNNNKIILLKNAFHKQGFEDVRLSFGNFIGIY